MKYTCFRFALLCSFLTACHSPHSPYEYSHQETAATYNAQLGMGYMQEGDMARSKLKLNRALELAPNLPIVHSSLGFYYEHIGDLVNAENAFKKAIALGGNEGEPHHNYGTYLCRQARYQEAEQQFHLAIKDEAYAFAAKTYENAGLCAMAAHEVEKAESYFKSAVQYDDQSPNALIELAHFAYDHQNYQEAKRRWEAYRALGFMDSRSLWLGIRIADKVGDKDKVASLSLLLRSKYPSSNEALLVREILKE